MKVKSESEVARLCPTLSDPMDCSPPGSSFHGIFQARVLEWGAIASSRYLLVPTLALPLSPLVTTSLFFISVSMFLFCYTHWLALFFRFHI